VLLPTLTSPSYLTPSSKQDLTHLLLSDITYLVGLMTYLSILRFTASYYLPRQALFSSLYPPLLIMSSFLLQP